MLALQVSELDVCWGMILTDQVVVLGSDHFPPNRVTELRDFILQHFIFEKVAHADRTPCDYIYPYVKESLKSLAGLVQKHGHDDLTAAGREKPPSSFSWEWNESNLQALISSRDSIKRYMKKRPAFLSDLAGAVEGYDALIEEAERTSVYMQAKLQRHENNQAIKESKNNLQLADSVRKLVLYIEFPKRRPELTSDTGSQLLSKVQVR